MRRLREAAGLKAREAAALLNSTSGQMSHMELGIAAVSAERVRRLAAHYACMDHELIDALVAMATDRTRGWWEEYRDVLPPAFMDTAEAEHHATYLREVVITHVPGLLQTADHARAIFRYMRPELSENEVAARVEHRMRRRAIIERAGPTPYETVIHEFALRVHVADRRASRAQLGVILDEIERGRVTVHVIPVAAEGFGGAGASMLYLGGPVSQLDTALRDSPTGVVFCDAQAQLGRLRTLFGKVKSAALDPVASRDLIHRLVKEM